MSSFGAGLNDINQGVKGLVGTWIKLIQCISNSALIMFRQQAIDMSSQSVFPKRVFQTGCRARKFSA
jgi:hypothetical protein